MERKSSDREKENESSSDRQRDREQESSSSNGAASPVASLHRNGGNQAVQRLYEKGEIQASLAVSQPSDPAERQAEQVAEQVMRASGTELQSESSRDVIIDRKATTGGSAVNEETKEQVKSMKGDGKPLSSSTRTFFEPRFGRDFSDVRVHTGPEADEAARSINAKAFTHGSDLVFRDGEYNPGNCQGKRLLAHELTHVVQQDVEKGTARSISSNLNTGTIQRQDAGTGQKQGEDTGSSQYSLPAGAPKRGDDSKPKEPESQSEGVKTAKDYEWSQHATITTRSASEWSDFLKNASKYANAVELNFFMAKSVGHTVFKPPESGNEQHAQRSWLELFQKPGRNAQANLMAAMLTTPGIDLNNISNLGPKQAFLMKRFISKNLAAGIDKVMQKRESTKQETVDDFTIRQSWIQTLLGQVGENWEDLKMQRAKRGGRTLMGRRSVSETMLSKAIANAQATAFAALATRFGEQKAEQGSEKTGSGQSVDWEGLRSDYTDEISQIGEIIGGVALEEAREDQLRSTVAGAAVDIVAGALGPIAGSIKGIGKQTLIQIGVDVTKNGGIAMIQGFGQGGNMTKANAETAIENSLKHHENELEVALAGDGSLPEGWSQTKSVLIARFIDGVQ